MTESEQEVKSYKYNGPRVWAQRDGRFALMGMWSQEDGLPIVAVDLTAVELIRLLRQTCETIRTAPDPVRARKPAFDDSITLEDLGL